jgi:hypothetical protein
MSQIRRVAAILVGDYPRTGAAGGCWPWLVHCPITIDGS